MYIICDANAKITLSIVKSNPDRMISFTRWNSKGNAILNISIIMIIIITQKGAVMKRK